MLNVDTAVIVTPKFKASELLVAATMLTRLICDEMLIFFNLNINHAALSKYSEEHTIKLTSEQCVYSPLVLSKITGSLFH